MSEYLKEVMRISDVANNGDGIYPDPEDETMVIIRNGDNVMKVPAAFIEALKERNDRLDYRFHLGVW